MKNQRQLTPKANASWKGGRIVGSDGYIFIYMPEHPKAKFNKNYVREHVLIAENALGKPLPDKAVVHHVNGDRQDNRLTNLVICENEAYHQLLHVRQRVIQMGGNPNTDKVCCRCKVPLKRDAFCRRAVTGDKLSPICRSCSKIEQEKY